MRTFEEIKQILLDRAKEKHACKTGYKMGLEAKNKANLLKAVTDNWWWVLCDARIVDANFLEENFTEEELTEAGIYTKGEHIVSTASFACGSVTVEACGSATVEACGSATVRAYDSVTVRAYNSVTVEAYGSVTVEVCGSVTVEAYGNSMLKILQPISDLNPIMP